MHRVVEALQLALAVGTGRAAHHQQAGAAVAVSQPGESLHGHAETLQGLDATHEQEHRLVPQPQSGPGAAAGPGREEGRVHAGRHHVDALGVRAVESGQLLDLGHGVGGDHIRARDHLGLRLDPALRLGVPSGGLYPGQGVERGHQRQVEFVLEPVRGHAGQPVVGVKHIDRVLPQARRNSLGELIDRPG